MMMGVFILVALLSLAANSSGWSTPQKQTARLSSTPASTTEEDALFNVDPSSTKLPPLQLPHHPPHYQNLKASATTSYTKNQEKALAQWKDSAAIIDHLLENWDTGDNISSGGGSQKEGWYQRHTQRIGST